MKPSARWTIVLLLTAAGGAFGAARSLSNIAFDETYDVFYQEQFHQLFPRIQAAVPRAYEKILREWGLEDSGGLRHPLTVQIKEVPSKTLRRWEAAFVEARGSGNNLRQFLVIPIGTYLQNPDEDLEQIVTHEMAHVLIMDIIAGPIPPWFNEGLAQSVTGEGRDRVTADKINLRYSGVSPILCDLDGPVDEFAHGPFNGNCYPEFYLAVQRLEQLGGPKTLQKVITGLRQGDKMSELIPAITGMDWPAFKKEAERYTNDVLMGRKS